jgi:hypothetical protein
VVGQNEKCLVSGEVFVVMRLHGALMPAACRVAASYGEDTLALGSTHLFVSRCPHHSDFSDLHELLGTSTKLDYCAVTATCIVGCDV